MSTLDLSLTKPATTYVKIASNMDTGQSVEPYLSLPQQDVIPGFVVESLLRPNHLQSQGSQVVCIWCCFYCRSQIVPMETHLGSPHNSWVGVLHRIMTLAA